MNNLQWTQVPKFYESWLPLDFLPPESDFVYSNSNSMSLLSPSSPLCLGSAFYSDTQSQNVIVVGNRTTSEYILVGAITAFRSITYFHLHKEGRIIGLRMFQPDIRPDEKPEEVVILRGSDWCKLMKEYARMAAKAMGVPEINPKKNLTGYCTWYYYYADVTEADFLENVKALKEKVGSAYSPAVIQIDDGYQTFQGDWLDQDKSWPTPLKKIAAEINEAGIVAGIWIMPMLASTASRTFRAHPEWFVKNTQGEPLVFAGWSPAPDNHWACLDATKQEVRDHITHYMKALWDMGFHYFKMDGLSFGLPRGVFSDPNATPVSAFRLALKTIREAVPDATLLACGPSFMACLGYVDMARVSNDTSRYWIGMEPDVENPPNCDSTDIGIQSAWHGTIANWWKYDVWFRADPDVIMARSDNAGYTIGEARISAAAGILTGVCLTSDHLGRITPDRMAILECAARYRLTDATPANWKLHRWPYAFTGTTDEKKAAVLVNDSEKEKSFKFADYGLPETCSEKLIGLGTVHVGLTLPPHDAAFVIAE